MSDRVTHQPAAEEAVLGALLLAPDALALIRPHLPSPDEFTEPRLATVYGAILAVHDRGTPVDHITLGAELGQRGVTEPAALQAELIDAAVSTANAEYHARIVADAARRRAMLAEAQRLQKLAADPLLDVPDVVADVCGRLVSLTAGLATRDTRALPGLLLDAVGRIHAAQSSGGGLAGISTGIQRLDTLTDGLSAGQLWIVAARPSQGKTAFALHLVRYCAREAPALLESLEMSRDKLCERLLAAESGVNVRGMLRDPAYAARKEHLLHAGADRLARLQLMLDASCRTPAQLRLALQAEAAQGRHHRVVVVDYLGLMHSDRPAETKNHELGQITGALKRIAMDMGLTVVALCQLSRLNVRENRAPILSDLRDSGNIEQDADVVCTLHWPNGKAEQGATAVDLTVAKARDGETGTIPLSFATWSQQWTEHGSGPATEYNADDVA